MSQSISQPLETAVASPTETPILPTASLVGGLRGHREAPNQLALAPAATFSPTDSAWNLLYGALISQLGASPKTFQLIYPMTSWNWATAAKGFTTSAQYDFCATIPQWSSVGAYVSSGTTYDGAYQQFLNTIMLDSNNPKIQADIVKAQNNLMQASVDYNTQYGYALDTYNSTVTGNTPDFTTWLGTPAGFAYNTNIQAAAQEVTAKQKVLTALSKQQTTPNIADAQAAMADQAYYTKYSDPGLSNNNLVPNWSLSYSAQQWTNQVQANGGTPGSINFSNSDKSYDYSQTWAKGSAQVSGAFWRVFANGSWQEVKEFYSDKALSCSISFKAWDTISITPSKWYSGTVALKNGPYNAGFSAYNNGVAGDTWMFGEGGVVPCFKTGMLVCYQPTITITVSQSVYQSFQNSWSAAVGVQVGPFQISGAAGGSSFTWSQSGSDMTLTVVSDSVIPLIFGANVAVQPQ